MFGDKPTPVVGRDLELVALEETRFHPNRFGGEFSVAPEFEDGTALVDFQDSLRFAR
jgi:hypothetical protein